MVAPVGAARLVEIFRDEFFFRALAHAPQHKFSAAAATTFFGAGQIPSHAPHRPARCRRPIARRRGCAYRPDGASVTTKNAPTRPQDAQTDPLTATTFLCAGQIPSQPPHRPTWCRRPIARRWRRPRDRRGPSRAAQTARDTLRGPRGPLGERNFLVRRPNSLPARRAGPDPDGAGCTGAEQISAKVPSRPYVY